ncbi:pyridoxal phosphate-dependent transferase [Xylariaceae sp. FL0804]|nr:pyridoxal phosphate-dependent transferase [Xylariaceae sp. FL0804]
MPAVYNNQVEALRDTEYPHMSKGVYLDHGGTTIYAKSTIERFASKMAANLYGNPHSENAPARLSGEVVDAVRRKTLAFLGADPAHFDLVFVANATAAVKLVGEAFRDLAEGGTRDRRGFWYGHHKDAHTSLVGVRELTTHRAMAHCFESDAEVDDWLRYHHQHHRHYPVQHPNDPSLVGGRHHDNHNDSNDINNSSSSSPAAAGLGLFAYPGQSNMTGRRLPLSWPGRVRESPGLRNTYTLLDAAALAMTFPMDSVFRDADRAPDFTCLSLYKIFGFPDVGALVVRRESGHILALRKYFGGGTVSMVAALGENRWHRSKGLQAPTYQLHEGLEDGTLPFHSILALGEAIDVHRRLYGSMSVISDHTSFLVARLHASMTGLAHANGAPLCHVYGEHGHEHGQEDDDFGDAARQGSALAFNVRRADGSYVPYPEVERRANDAGIYIRSGGVCNPGGIFTALGYEPWMTRRALSAGHHCGSQGISIIHQLPTGYVPCLF